MASLYILHDSELVFTSALTPASTVVDPSFLVGFLVACKGFGDYIERAEGPSGTGLGGHGDGGGHGGGGGGGGGAGAGRSGGGDAVAVPTGAQAAAALSSQTLTVATHTVRGLMIVTRDVPHFTLALASPVDTTIGGHSFLLAKLRLIFGLCEFLFGVAEGWHEDVPDFDGSARDLILSLFAFDSAEPVVPPSLVGDGGGAAGVGGGGDDRDGATVVPDSFTVGPRSRATGPHRGSAGGGDRDGGGSGGDSGSVGGSTVTMGRGRYREADLLRLTITAIMEGIPLAVIGEGAKAKLARLLGRLREDGGVHRYMLVLRDAVVLPGATFSPTESALVLHLIRSRPLRALKMRVMPVHSRGDWRQLVMLRTKVCTLAAFVSMRKPVREYEAALEAFAEQVDESLPALPTEEAPVFVHHLTSHEGVLTFAVKDHATGVCIVPSPRPGPRWLAGGIASAFAALYQQAMAAMRNNPQFAIADVGGSANGLTRLTGRPGGPVAGGVGPGGASVAASGPAGAGAGASGAGSGGGKFDVSAGALKAREEDASRWAAVQSAGAAMTVPATSWLTLQHAYGYQFVVSARGGRETYVLFGSKVEADDIESTVASIEEATVERFRLPS